MSVRDLLNFNVTMQPRAFVDNMITTTPQIDNLGEIFRIFADEVNITAPNGLFVNGSQIPSSISGNALTNDSGQVQASGVVYVSDNTTVGGCSPTQNLSITDQTSSINILNNASLVFNNTLTGYNYNVNIDDSGYLNINNSVKQQQINLNSAVNISGELDLQDSSILKFLNDTSFITLSPDNTGNLNFGGGAGYNFDGVVSAPNLQNLLYNPLQSTLNAGNQPINNIFYLQLNDKFTLVENQYTIQGVNNVLTFSGGSQYNFSSDIATGGSVSGSAGLNGGALTVNGISALKGDLNIYNSSNDTLVTTISENIDGDLIVYNNNGGQVNIQNASLIGLQSETHIINGSLYIDKADKTWHMSVDENTGQALFNGASSYGFDNNILTSGSVSSDLDMMSAGYQVQNCNNGVDRPSSPVVGQMFWDSNINLPIWWSNLMAWVNALGVAV